MDGIEFWTTFKKGLRPLSHIAHLNSSNCSHLKQYIFLAIIFVSFFSIYWSWGHEYLEKV